MAAIEAKYLINDRSVKRAADREVRKVWSIIEQIEFDFESAIFYAPEFMSYKQIYEHYLDVWREAIEALKMLKLKYIKVNEYHFSEQYKPLQYLK